MDNGVIDNFYQITTTNERELAETNTFMVKIFSKHSDLFFFVELPLLQKLNQQPFQMYTP